MLSTEPLPAVVLRRKAVVYIRQSSQTQVQVNLESQRRQYDLVEEARRRGFQQVEVIDDDLGRSAARPAAWSRARASIVWWRGCAPAKSAPSCLRRVAPGAQRPRLASLVGALRAGRRAGYRPGRRLRSVSPQ